MLELLTSALYRISNFLLAPVIVCLLGMLAWTVLLVGGFLREWYERRNMARLLDGAEAAARRGLLPSSIWKGVTAARAGLPKRLAGFVQDEYQDPKVLEQGLTRLDNDIAASLAKHSFITRVSPILGLMGTLIPLGPALSGLANGNMQALSGNLIVAFTATVVGLLISGLAYGMGLARRVWYAADMSSLELIVETIAPAVLEERVVR
jgi:biopolymer transport protein ExbB/TolQ